MDSKIRRINLRLLSVVFVVVRLSGGLFHGYSPCLVF